MRKFDDSPAFRDQRSTIASKMVERFAGDEHLNSPEARLEYFDALGSDNFVKLLSDTDRVLTKQHSDNPFVTENYNYILDEEDPLATFEIMPAPEDKIPLLKNLYEKARTIPYDNPEAIDQIAAFVGFGINAIHPFTEGNGRTARTIYTLLTANDTNRDELLHRAAQDVEMGQLYLNPSTFRNPLMEFMQEALPTHRRILGELVPNIKPAVTSRMALSAIRPLNRPSKKDTTVLLEAVFHDRHISEMIPSLLVRRPDFSSANQVIRNYEGQQVFDITTFVKVAPKKDIALLRNAYRAITNEYTGLLMEVMSGSTTLIERTIVPSKEYGVCAIPPLSLITKLAQGRIHLDIAGYEILGERVARNEFIEID